ncbi:diiron oxygenase [Pseudomonas putida]|uniref:diiron oxygenase n=1 Tax=Pseudomonas putida TaxID=303 RepID=UPI00301D9A84
MAKTHTPVVGSRAFKDWDRRSAVRSRPYQYCLSSRDLAVLEPERWYPTCLCPALQLEELRCLPSSSRLTAHIAHLVHFLDYTTSLELTVVNECVASITLGDLKRYFTSTDQRMALLLYTDEGYHASFSRKIADQVSEHFNLARYPSMRLSRLNYYLKKAPENYRYIAVFLVAFVSETVITKELLDLTRLQLIEPVFNMLRDHLHDEARHAIFFSGCLAKLLPQLSESEKAFTAHALSDILEIFFRPDREFLAALFGQDSFHFNIIIEQLESVIKERLPQVAAPTLLAIQRSTLLEDRVHRELFRKRGLLP